MSDAGCPIASSRPNAILQQLSASAANHLQPCLDFVELRAGEVLEAPGKPIRHLHFPVAGLVSLTAVGFGGRRIGVAIVGSDSATGMTLALGRSRSSSMEATVEVPGAAWRLAAQDFMHVSEEREELRNTLLRAYDHCERVMSAALALGRLPLVQRLEQWLLNASEILAQPVVPLTHQRLADLLAVRRPSITMTLQELEAAGVLRARRGAIEILDKTQGHELGRGLSSVDCLRNQPPHTSGAWASRHSKPSASGPIPAAAVPAKLRPKLA
jgi:CRP-like cAMP-binding protein